jgi:hypothetical protein
VRVNVCGVRVSRCDDEGGEGGALGEPHSGLVGDVLWESVTWLAGTRRDEVGQRGFMRFSVGSETGERGSMRSRVAEWGQRKGSMGPRG